MLQNMGDNAAMYLTTCCVPRWIFTYYHSPNNNCLKSRQGNHNQMNREIGGLVREGEEGHWFRRERDGDVGLERGVGVFDWNGGGIKYKLEMNLQEFTREEREMS